MSAVLDWLAAAVAALGFGSEAQVYNGYAEADYVHVAPLTAGRIVSLAADEGDSVAAGQVLVLLETDSQTAALQAAEAAVAVAKANLDNLQTGSRAAEIAVVAASLHRAEADRNLARTTLARSQRLLDQGRVPQAEVDRDRSALESAEAQVDQLSAELEVAQLPARDAQRLAAEAALDMARAEADVARSNLRDRSLATPVAGKVERRFYEPGEVAASGAPVLSIFQPDRVKAVFFVPEPKRAATALGDRLSVSCDGCPPGLSARITRLASDPQYTPPILYSRDERDRLVFRAEAVIDEGSGLLPGQPLSLSP